jgi:hypothetical protein
VIHAIQPRLERNPMSWANTDMPWSSVYIELDGDGEKFLRRSGHRRFPVLAPRWRVTGLDIYGHGPGRKALNNVLQLQAQELEKGKAMAVQADPPTQVPVSVKHLTRELLPGGVIPYDQSTPHGGVRTAYEVPLNLDHMRLDSMEVRRRIEAAFYVPLFQTLNSLNDSTERTAFEMRARREEAFTLLGPVTQRLNNELDEPLVRTIIERMIETGMVEPPPPELQGQPLEIEFLGPLAQALKAVGLTNTDRFVAGLGIVAGLKPDVRDKFDEDSWAEQYADVLGVHPDLIVPGPKVALIRESRAQAMAAKERNEMMATQAGTVRDLAAAPTGGEPNALTDITGTLAGYTQPAGVGL